MSQSTNKKLLLHGLLALPIIMLSYNFVTGQLGVEPIESILHESGEWSLRLLLLTLLMTPLKKILKSPKPLLYRRLIGLWCFFYAVVHLSIFVVFEISLDLTLLLKEITQRNFIIVGFISFIILLILTSTSTRKAQRRLGRKWQSLHRWVYVALGLGLIHLWMLTKSDYSEPVIYSLVALLFMLARIDFKRFKTTN